MAVGQGRYVNTSPACEAGPRGTAHHPRTAWGGELLLPQLALLNVKSVKPDSSGFENIYVKKVAEDAKQSTFIIWIKQGVKAHYHATHTEFVTVISGRGIMQLGDKTFKVKKGDCVVIPLGEAHSALTTSKKPLKV